MSSITTLKNVSVYHMNAKMEELNQSALKSFLEKLLERRQNNFSVVIRKPQEKVLRHSSQVKTKRIVKNLRNVLI